jgi:hypothetical protein
MPPSATLLSSATTAWLAADFDGDPRHIGAGFGLGYDELRSFRLLLPLRRR